MFTEVQLVGPEVQYVLYRYTCTKSYSVYRSTVYICVCLRFLTTMPEEDPNRQPILQLMGEMYNRQARIGYYLLYFIKVGSVTTPIV